MKPSWILVFLLLILVAVFSVQNAGVITLQFLAWHFTISAALAILVAALIGSLIGLVIGVLAGRSSASTTTAASPAAGTPPANTSTKESHEST